MIKPDKMKKLFKLMGLDKLTSEGQKNSKKLLQQMVVHKKAGPEKEQMYLYLMEQFLHGIGANRLDKKDQIDLREKLDTIIGVEALGLDKVKPEARLLYEQYFPKYKPTAKTISKDMFKFKNPEQDVNDVLQIKKSEFRFKSDKEKDNQKLTATGGLI